MSRKKYTKPKGTKTSSAARAASANKTFEPEAKGERIPADKAEKDEGDKPDPKVNDPEWYSKDNQLVLDAASLPYSECLGDPIPLTNQIQMPNTVGYDHYVNGQPLTHAVGGILTAKVKSSFGFNDNIKSPLNVAAQMLYSQVRYMNSGRKNYDAPDLAMYVISMADVYAFIVWCMRIYDKAYMYSQRNKYIGNDLLASENIDHQSIVDNLANFRYWLNTYINKVAAYAIPSDISYFSRRVWMFSGIYLENPDSNIKDQLYQFTPDGFYSFDLDTNKAGKLKYSTITTIVGHSNALTYGDLVTIGNYLFANVNGDEDFGLMSGDIIKAFNGKIIMLNSVAEEASIIPVYSEYVLEQFHNMRVVNVLRDNTAVQIKVLGDTDTKHVSGDVYQMATDGILRTYELVPWEDIATTDTIGKENSIDMVTQQVLDINTPSPSPIDTMEISRLCVTGKSIVNIGQPAWYLGISCGADVVTELSMCYRSNTNVFTNVVLNSTINDLTNNPKSYAVNVLLNLFKYAPLLKSITNSGINLSFGFVQGNINNYTVVNNDVLDKMHQVALLSLLSVPGVAKMVNVLS